MTDDFDPKDAGSVCFWPKACGIEDLCPECEGTRHRHPSPYGKCPHGKVGPCVDCGYIPPRTALERARSRWGTRSQPRQ